MKEVYIEEAHKFVGGGGDSKSHQKLYVHFQSLIPPTACLLPSGCCAVLYGELEQLRGGRVETHTHTHTHMPQPLGNVFSRKKGSKSTTPDDDDTVKREGFTCSESETGEDKKMTGRSVIEMHLATLLFKCGLVPPLGRAR